MSKWFSTAQVTKMLNGLATDDGKKSGGKGGGKGSPGKGAEPLTFNRTCQRDGCRAATKKQATFGDAAGCFECGLSLTATLPVEQLVAWAWLERLEAKKATQQQLQQQQQQNQQQQLQQAKGTPAVAPGAAAGSLAHHEGAGNT